MDIEQELKAAGDASLLEALHECNWDRARTLLKQKKGIGTIACLDRQIPLSETNTDGRSAEIQTPSSKWTALHFASFNDAPIDIIEDLVKGGVDVNAANKSGSSALSFAAQKCHLEVCKVLLHAKADPNLHSSVSGGTPLHEAIVPGTSEELLKALLDAGADPNSKTQAAGVNAILRELGCDTSELNYDGATPLILAVKKKLPVDIIRVLVENGCDPSIPDAHGKNALDYARALQLDELIPQLSIIENLEELKARRCVYCGKIAQAWLPRCAGCNVAAYCDRQVGNYSAKTEVHSY